MSYVRALFTQSYVLSQWNCNLKGRSCTAKLIRKAKGKLDYQGC